MQQYRIASWILLIHSIINFTLSAPVAVGDINGVRVNVVDVAKDRMAVLRERMDPNEDPDGGQSSDLTSEHGAPGPEPDSESESDSNSEIVSESESDSDDSDGGEAAQQWEEEFQNYEPSDIEDEGHEDDNHEGDDSEEDDHMQSPPHSPESHPAASTFDDIWSKLLKGLMRPRAPTSGAIDASKRGLQETDDTRASMARDVSEFFNAPTTSASSVTGRGGATSLYSPASGHNQNRKRWLLDRLD